MPLCSCRKHYQYSGQVYVIWFFLNLINFKKSLFFSVGCQRANHYRTVTASTSDDPTESASTSNDPIESAFKSNDPTGTENVTTNSRPVS